LPPADAPNGICTVCEVEVPIAPVLVVPPEYAMARTLCAEPYLRVMVEVDDVIEIASLTIRVAIEVVTELDIVEVSENVIIALNRYIFMAFVRVIVVYESVVNPVPVERFVHPVIFASTTVVVSLVNCQ
jgi:hypothetical protein